LLFAIPNELQASSAGRLEASAGVPASGRQWTEWTKWTEWTWRPCRPRTAKRRHAGTPAPLLPVRYPNILHLGGVPEEFFALALFGGEPVARFTLGDPGRFQVAG